MLGVGGYWAVVLTIAIGKFKFKLMYFNPQSLRLSNSIEYVRVFKEKLETQTFTPNTKPASNMFTKKLEL